MGSSRIIQAQAQAGDMCKLKRALAFGGILLAGLLVLTSYGAAQDASPTLTTLYNLGEHSGDGYQPNGLAIDAGGVLYGTTYTGGARILEQCFH